jgi:ATP-dependent helicase HrpA
LGFQAACKKWERTGIMRWDFGDLPDDVRDTGTAETRWMAYPALDKSPDGDKRVNLRLFRQRDESIAAHMQGVAALYRIHFSRDLKFLKKCLMLFGKAKSMANYFGGIKQFERRMFDTIVDRLFAKNIRSESDFYAYAEVIAPKIIPSGQELLEQVLPVITVYHETRTLLNSLQQAHPTNRAAAAIYADLEDELSRLMPENFIDLYDAKRFVHIERYMKANGIRARRAAVDLEKDRAKHKEIQPFQDSLNQLLKSLSAHASLEKRSAIEEFFWMIEEFKVSVFAQELKTAFPVSKKRLQEKLKQIDRMI